MSSGHARRWRGRWITVRSTTAASSTRRPWCAVAHRATFHTPAHMSGIERAYNLAEPARATTAHASGGSRRSRRSADARRGPPHPAFRSPIAPGPNGGHALVSTGKCSQSPVSPKPNARCRRRGGGALGVALTVFSTSGDAARSDRGRVPIMIELVRHQGHDHRATTDRFERLPCRPKGSMVAGKEDEKAWDIAARRAACVCIDEGDTAIGAVPQALESPRQPIRARTRVYEGVHNPARGPSEPPACRLLLGGREQAASVTSDDEPLVEGASKQIWYVTQPATPRLGIPTTPSPAHSLPAQDAVSRACACLTGSAVVPPTWKPSLAPRRRSQAGARPLPCVINTRENLRMSSKEPCECWTRFSGVFSSGRPQTAAAESGGRLTKRSEVVCALRDDERAPRGLLLVARCRVGRVVEPLGLRLLLRLGLLRRLGRL